ncbi:MAG: type I secretion C-terminal target domain-containing protein, partial [Alphaproteobacteria bacterium]|nr:type I secretion C-terminal target domain-containing protein [Alphaproteobacteria bacterium]MBU2105611.1 type I secretion C-terminal target domain-containing protein [Alphaproteobacteria bacterium]
LIDNTLADPDSASFAVVVTDADGDSAPAGNLVITIIDDLPTAVADTALSVSETASATTGVNLLANDVEGADGATVTHVDLGSGPTAITAGNYLGGGVYAFTVTGVGTYTFKADGDWTFDPVVNPSSSDTTANFTYTITDGDGDPSSALQVVNVLNANNVPSAGTVAATVDDDALHGGNPGGTGDLVVAPDPDGNEATFSGTLTGSGGDGALTFTFANLHNTSATIGQENVTYSWSAGTNTLYAIITGGTRDGQALFSVKLAPSTGIYDLTLLKPVMHPAGGNETSIIANLAYQVSDSDGDTSAGDTATGQLQITFNDDTPDNFTAQPMRIENGSNSIGSGQLNFYESIGADGGNAVFTGTNNALLKTTGNVTVTSGGQDVHLFGFGTGTLTGKVGSDSNGAGGTTVFTVTLSPDAIQEPSDVYTVQFFRALDDGSGTSISPSNFTDTSARDYKSVDGTSDKDILISASDGGSVGRVNGSNGSGVTSFGVGNPAISSNETLRFDFASSVVLTGSGAGNGFTYGAHYDVNGFSFTVENGGSTSNVLVVAFDANNDTNLTNDGGSKDTITEIYKNGVLVPLGGLVSSNGGYIVPATDGDIISVFTSNGYNRVEVGYSSGQNFSIASVGYLQLNSGSNIPLTFNVTATDSDGDSASGTISVTTTPIANTRDGTPASEALVAGTGGDTLNGLGGDDWLIGGLGADVLNGGTNGFEGDTAVYRNSASGVSVNLSTNSGTGGDAQGDTYSGIENIMGSNFADTLTGDALANILYGLDGADTLSGLGGADTLIGGAGQDTLTGGDGADTFVLTHLDINDVITDYSGVGGHGDKIDLTALFDATPGTIGDYVNYNAGTGMLSVDVDGAANGANFVDVAALTGSPVASTITLLYDDGTTTHTITADVV